MNPKTCILEKAGKAKLFYQSHKLLSLLLLAVLLAAIVLRLLFINSTDITEDEAFYVSYAYKLAFILWSYPILAIAIGIASAFFVYAIAFKRWLWATVLFAAGLLAAKYVVGIPYAMHAPSPFFTFATAAVIYFSNLVPNIAGELISTASMLGLAFLGFWFGRRWGTETGAICFALLALSPFSVFMSATSFLTPLGMLLMVLSLAIFYKGMDNTKLLPAAGIIYSLAFMTRFTTLVMLPLFAFMLWINRKKFSGTTAKKHLAIALIVFLAVFAFYLPLVEKQFSIATIEWHEVFGPVRSDLTEANYSAFVLESIGSANRSLYDNFFVLKAMNLFYTPFGLALIVLGLGYAILQANKFKDQWLALFIALFLLMFSFFFFVMQDKRINYLAELEFPAMLLAAVFLGSKKISGSRIRKIAAIGICSLFLAQSACIVSTQHFKGLSETVSKLPEDGVLFLGVDGIRDPTKYYRQFYLYDLTIRKELFQKLFPENPEQMEAFEWKSSTVVTELKDEASIDYAFVGKKFLESQEAAKLASFKKCSEVKVGKQTLFWLYAREACP